MDGEESAGLVAGTLRISVYSSFKFDLSSFSKAF